MTELNIFDSAQKAAELLKLKTASDNISSQPVKKLSKLKQYIIDKYDEISHEKKSLSQALIQSISDIETSIYRYETLKKSNFAEAAASEKSNILKSIDNVLNYSRNLQMILCSLKALLVIPDTSGAPQKEAVLHVRLLTEQNTFLKKIFRTSLIQTANVQWRS